MLGFFVPFTSFNILCKNCRTKPFCRAKLACFDFSSSNFLLQGYIVSTGGAALFKRTIVKLKDLIIVWVGEFFLSI
jgi:hypothetical protein